MCRESTVPFSWKRANKCNSALALSYAVGNRKCYKCICFFRVLPQYIHCSALAYLVVAIKWQLYAAKEMYSTKLWGFTSPNHDKIVRGAVMEGLRNFKHLGLFNEHLHQSIRVSGILSLSKHGQGLIRQP